MKNEFIIPQTEKIPSNFEKLKHLSKRYLSIALALGVLGTAIAKMSQETKPVPVPKVKTELKIKPEIHVSAPEQKSKNTEAFDENSFRKNLQAELNQKNSDELMSILTVINDKVGKNLMTKKIAKIYLEEIKLRLQQLGKTRSASGTSATSEEVIQDEGYTKIIRRGNGDYTQVRIQTKN